MIFVKILSILCVFLVETSRKMNVDIIYLHMSKYVPILVCLLKMLLLTSEYDSNNFHAYNSKEIFI